METEQIVKLCQQSSFNRSHYKVHIDLRNLIKHRTLQIYTDFDQKAKGCPLKHATPGFQRSNDKWTPEQKKLFVENVLKGFESTITLFKMGSDKEAKILDGLQRLTSLWEFCENKLKTFGKLKSDFTETELRIIKPVFALRIYDFEDWEEVGRFYIERNEGITHSAEDIQKCKDWFLENKRIIL